MFSLFALVSSLEAGLALALVALGVFISYRVLSFPDLTVDGSFPLGAVISATLITAGGDPWASLALAVAGGIIAGMITSWLHVRLGISHLLASIITMTGLYSLNLRIMGRPNLSLLGSSTVFSIPEQLLVATFGEKVAPYANLIVLPGIVAVVGIAVVAFLATELGLALRATGDNPKLAAAQGIDTGYMTYVGLGLANGLVALAGGLFAQMQGSADVSMGIGTIISGIVAVIAGESLGGGRGGLARQAFAVVIGSLLYRLAIGVALSFESGERWWSVQASDLNLITAILIVAFLTAPRLRRRGRLS